MRKGLQILDLIIGDGPEAVRRSNVRVRYDLLLDDGSSVENARECDIWLHRGHLIPGLFYGIEGMRVGGRRRIRIEPFLAYGHAGLPGRIPPDSALTFELELLGIKPAWSHNSTPEG